MSEVTIRPYQLGDEASINDGFNRTFNLTRSIDEWRWKFPDQPGGRPIMVAVDTTGQVLAHYAAVSVDVQIDGRIVKGGQIVDVYSLPQARLGLATARVVVDMVNAFGDQFFFNGKLTALYGFPSGRLLQLGVTRHGYAEVPPAPLPVWFRDSKRRGQFFTRHQVRQGVDLPAVDDLWRRARVRYPVAAVRDSSWIKRRFAGRPGVDYLHLSIWRGGQVHVYSVLRVIGDWINVAELVWDGSDARALAALDTWIASFGKRVNAKRIELWMANDPQAAEVFTNLGWTVTERPETRVVFRCSDREIKPEQLAGRFYVTMGDADLV